MYCYSFDKSKKLWGADLLMHITYLHQEKYKSQAEKIKEMSSTIRKLEGREQELCTALRLKVLFFKTMHVYDAN